MAKKSFDKTCEIITINTRLSQRLCALEHKQRDDMKEVRELQGIKEKSSLLDESVSEALIRLQSMAGLVEQSNMKMDYRDG